MPGAFGARLPVFEGPRVAVQAEGAILQWATDEYIEALSFKTPEDYGYGLLYRCPERATFTGNTSWGALRGSNCAGLQGWPWNPFPVPAGVNEFTVFQEYVPFPPPLAHEGAFYEVWVYPGPGPAPGFNPGPFRHALPVLDPFADPAAEAAPMVERGYAVDPVAPPAAAARRSPPEEKDREKKAKMEKGSPAALMRAIHHAATEGLDALDALWGALPRKARTSSKCGTPGTARSWGGLSSVSDPTKRTGGCYVTPQQKAADLIMHWDQLDVGTAIRNLVNNEIGDQLIGRLQGGAMRGLNDTPVGRINGGPLVGGMGLPPPRFDKNWNITWELG